MKYSGHRKQLCASSKLSKFNALLNEHWCIYSSLQIPPKENWFQCVRRVYTTAINFPCITPLTDYSFLSRYQKNIKNVYWDTLFGTMFFGGNLFWSALISQYTQLWGSWPQTYLLNPPFPHIMSSLPAPNPNQAISPIIPLYPEKGKMKQWNVY